jgi:hypothetical protein
MISSKSCHIVYSGNLLIKKKNGFPVAIPLIEFELGEDSM